MLRILLEQILNAFDQSGILEYNGLVIPAGSPEIRRLKEIDRRAARLRRRHRKIHNRWALINKERMDLERELREIAEERDTLVQGQLLFPE